MIPKLFIARGILKPPDTIQYGDLAGFDVGELSIPHSRNRIIQGPIRIEQMVLVWNRHRIPLGVVASKRHKQLDDYLRDLALFLDGVLASSERTEFDEAVHVFLWGPAAVRHPVTANVWHDTEHDIMFVIRDVLGEKEAALYHILLNLRSRLPDLLAERIGDMT